MSGIVTFRLGVQATAPPAATPIQYIVGSPIGLPLYLNQSAAAGLEYITPAAYVNEAP